MFDREGFIEYVGDKSRNSYASGLNRIEKMYSADIDMEYVKDKCEALLAQIERDKQRTALDQKELKERSDAASHLRRYILYKMNSMYSVSDGIRLVIDHYKAHFEKVNEGERYKWEAIGWYKKYWNIGADDFAEMLRIAFSKTSNLMASGNYYPYKMIVEYAQSNPKEVRRIFRILHDEQKPLGERYQIFRESCSGWIEHISTDKSLNHYQDLRAIIVYLTFQYPEKYYLYKSTMYSDFRDRIGFREDQNAGSSVMNRLGNYFQMCELVLSEIKKDQELIALHRS